MKKKLLTIDEEIQQTLACINCIERVEINPWLPTRLNEKSKEKRGHISMLAAILNSLITLQIR